MKKMEIEELMRDSFADERQDVPADAWGKIENGLRQSAKATKRRRAGRKVALGVACGVAVGALSLWLLTGTTQEPARLLAYQDDGTEESHIVEPTMPDAVVPAATSATVANGDVREAETPSSPTPAMNAHSPLQSNTQPAQSPRMDGCSASSSPNSEAKCPSSPAAISAKQEDSQTRDAAELPMPTSYSTATPAIAPSAVASRETDASNDLQYAQNDGDAPLPPSDILRIIPNVITPNGDGYNDCWVIPDLERYGKVQVQIYTAGNQRVYSSPSYDNSFCGADLPSGNYFYILKLHDYNIVRRGVLVIRR